MHVHTAVDVDAAQVRAAFREACVSRSAGVGTFSFDEARTPPKFRCAGGAFGIPPSAELMFDEHRDRVDVILRLMWGPLPAPFPGWSRWWACWPARRWRSQAPWAIAAGLGLALAPVWAWFRQQRGERELQARLAGILAAAPFVPRPH